MPKLYEYLGLIIFFYSNEHNPVHVHAQYNEYESKAEFKLVNGEIIDIIIKNVAGRKPLQGSKLNDFQTILEHFSNDIVSKWVEFFVYNREIECIKVNRRLR